MPQVIALFVKELLKHLISLGRAHPLNDDIIKFTKLFNKKNIGETLGSVGTCWLKSAYLRHFEWQSLGFSIKISKTSDGMEECEDGKYPVFSLTRYFFCLTILRRKMLNQAQIYVTIHCQPGRAKHPHSNISVIAIFRQV